MFIPTNEQGVIFLWGGVCHLGGWNPIHLQTRFPDAIFEKDGEEYLIEFEYKSSNFLAHGHDFEQCDLIICWENDLHGLPIPVIELQNPEWFKASFSKYGVNELIDLACNSAKEIDKLRKMLNMPNSSTPSRTAKPKRIGWTKLQSLIITTLADRYNNGNNVLRNVSELANLCGTSRGTVHATLNEAIDRGIISRDPNGYTILKSIEDINTDF